MWPRSFTAPSRPLPLSIGLALKIIAWRAQSEQKRKHSSATTVLWLVRSARDALLPGEVHEYLTKKGKVTLSSMRIGVLRTTEGIAEVDKALRFFFTFGLFSPPLAVRRVNSSGPRFSGARVNTRHTPPPSRVSDAAMGFGL